MKVGGLAHDSFEYLSKELYDTNRHLSHLPKIELIKGDICETRSNLSEGKSTSNNFYALP